MLSKDEIISREADEFLWHLMPFGSLDIMHMVRTAYEVKLTSRELAVILYEQAEDLDIDLFNQDRTTDLNALLNDYILNQARNDIEAVLGIDIVNDYDVYFYANYLDCPLQYSNECQEAIEQAIKEKEATRDDFNNYALYILDEMGISVSDEVTEEEEE